MSRPPAIRAPAARRAVAPRSAAPRDPAGRIAPRGVAGRRTVTITGRGAERHVPRSYGSARQRPQRRPYERAGFRPDRAALWAVLLCVVLLLVAATSSHAAMLGSRSVPTVATRGASVSMLPYDSR